MNGKGIAFHLHGDNAGGQSDGVCQQEAAKIRLEPGLEGNQGGGHHIAAQQDVPRHHQGGFDNLPEQHRGVGAENGRFADETQLHFRRVAEQPVFQQPHGGNNGQPQKHNLGSHLSVQQQPEEKKNDVHDNSS